MSNNSSTGHIAGKILRPSRVLRKAAAILINSVAQRRRRSLYGQASSFLARSDQWKAEPMAAWQLRQLNRLLQHALKNCPGHARKLKTAGFNGKLERLEEIGGL